MSKIEIEWAEPSNPNGIIEKYWVEFQIEDASKNNNINRTTWKNRHSSKAGEEKYSLTVLSTDGFWMSKSTNDTSIYLDEIQCNVAYLVRVKAETKAGVGKPSATIAVSIFNKKSQPLEPNDKPKEDSKCKKYKNRYVKFGFVYSMR